MPLAFSSPEWGNEKGLAAATALRLAGISSYHCVHAPMLASPAVSKCLTEECLKIFGSAMVIDVDPKSLAMRMVSDLAKRRANLS